MSGGNNTTLKFLQGDDNVLSFKLEPAKKVNVKSEVTQETKSERKARKVTASNFFYSFENHSELHKIGQLYEEDFKAGKKIFSTSTPYSEEDDVVLNLVLASYFGAFCDTRATLFVSREEMNKINSLVYDFDHVKYKFKKSKGSIQIFKSSFVNVIVLDDLIHLSETTKGKKSVDFEEALKELTKDSKISFISVPTSDDASKSKRNYQFTILKMVANICLLVTFGEDRFDELDKQIDLLNNYKVEIKGVVVRSSFKKKVIEKKPASRGRTGRRR